MGKRHRKLALVESFRGRLDLVRKPALQQGWGGPMNGQRFRQRILFDLLYAFPIGAIIETGTYLGTTTALFAATCLPVFSAEIHPRHFAFSRMRFLLNRSNVRLFRNDSRSFLRTLAANARVPKDDVFFYLDAHWGEDLPLLEELHIVFSNWRNPIVMIDDFRVPNSGYGFDDYGPGKAIDLDYIAPAASSHGLSIYFPAMGHERETGSKRGSVVLCTETVSSVIDAGVPTLVRHRPS